MRGQELLHAYLPVGREETLDAGLMVVEGCTRESWPVDAAVVRLARALADGPRGIGARDLLHLASCTRREVTELKTFDRALAAAWRGRSYPSRPEELLRCSNMCLATTKSPRGTVFASFSFNDVPVSILTGAGYDPVTDTAELKVCPVRIEPCEGPATRPGDVAAD